MIFATPDLTSDLRRELDELGELHSRLGDQVETPGPWFGQLRRLVRATAAESSISIEGFHVERASAVAVVAGDEAVGSDDTDRMALAAYARAMDHVGVMATDPAFRWQDRVILDLHFDACAFQRDTEPGRWRRGPIAVTAPEGGLAYTGPNAGDVPRLMDEVVDWLERGDRDAHHVVRAALAHLHIVSVHPFRDGNGRIARIVQSLVLAREGAMAPEFSSIEEYLGGHTGAYYSVLREVQGGSYQPRRDATPWIAFCLRAHVEQARSRLGQIADAAERWSRLEDLVGRRGWPDRLAIALEQSLFERSDRASYAAEADVSLATASADFRRLVDAQLVVQQGKGRNTRYVAADRLRRELGRPSAAGQPQRSR